MPPPGSFHHGNLRAELLDRAEAVLHERGAEALSLRELAREAGVSHGAPRSHFTDRGALLEALAARGFDRLAGAIQAAASALPATSLPATGEAAPALLRAAGRAYLDFAADNPGLLNLMITAKTSGASGPVHDAAMRLFTVTSTLLAAALGPRPGGAEDVERLTLVLSATIQGISSLVTSGRIPAERGDTLLTDAIRVFLAGARGTGGSGVSSR